MRASAVSGRTTAVAGPSASQQVAGRAGGMSAEDGVDRLRHRRPGVQRPGDGGGAGQRVQPDARRTAPSAVAAPGRRARSRRRGRGPPGRPR